MSISSNFPTSRPSLSFNFLRATSLDPRITFARNSIATYFDDAGVLTTVAANVPRFDYDPSTLNPRGFLIEESRINSIRNNTMVGAVAGTPGTLPTNWSVVLGGGLSQSVVGSGTENGISYVDITISGTPTQSSYVNIVPDSLVAGVSGQTWNGSFWAKLVGGNFTNTTPFIEIRENDAAQTFLTNTLTGISISSTTLTRFNESRTLTNASTAYVSVRSIFQFTNGLPINFTVRIGMPQLEQGAFATSVIPTSSVAVTRNADVASVNTLTPWFNATEGTLFADLVNITRKTAVDYPRLVSLVGSNVNNDEISIYTRTQGFGTGMGYGSVTAGGTNTFDPGNPATTVDAWKAAIAYKTNDTAFACSGLVTATDTSVTLPTCVELRLFGQARFQLMPSGWLRRFAYYPTRLSNSQLQALTLS